MKRQRGSGSDNSGTNSDMLNLLNINMDIDESDGTANTLERVSIDELINEPQYGECFACRYINEQSLNENELFYKLMKIYVDNVCTISRHAVFSLMHEFFQTEVKPAMSNEGIAVNWTVDEIKTHFQFHTNFPTDEVLRQIRISTSLRNTLINYIVQMSSDKSEAKFDINYIKTAVLLNQEIRKLCSMKKDLPGLIGFNQSLNF